MTPTPSLAPTLPYPHAASTAEPTRNTSGRRSDRSQAGLTALILSVHVVGDTIRCDAARRGGGYNPSLPPRVPFRTRKSNRRVIYIAGKTKKRNAETRNSR